MIFISYRRSDAASFAGRLRDELIKRFDVFLDTHEIEVGESFGDVIDRQLRAASVVLVVIGPNWLSAKDVSHRRRIDDEYDWVHQEVRRSLAAGNKRVIPLLAGDHVLPAADALPESLRGLVTRQAHRIRHESWDADLTALVNELTSLVPARERGASPLSPESIAEFRLVMEETIRKTVGAKYIKSLYVSRDAVESQLNGHVTRTTRNRLRERLRTDVKRLSIEVDRKELERPFDPDEAVVQAFRVRGRELVGVVADYLAAVAERPLTQYDHQFLGGRVQAQVRLLDEQIGELKAFVQMREAQRTGRRRSYPTGTGQGRTGKEKLPERLAKLTALIKRHVDSLQEDAKPIFMLVDKAGRGKTNLLCDFASRCASSRPAIFVAARALRAHHRSLDEAIQLAIDKVAKGASLAELARQVGADQQIVVIIDGINESPDPATFAAQFAALLAASQYDNIRFVVTCREEYWPFFARQISPDVSILRMNSLGKFGHAEFDLAITKYFRHFKIGVELAGEARAALHDPLLLRFFCEAYKGKRRGGNVVAEIRRLALFEMYTTRKIAEIAECRPGSGPPNSVAERIEQIAVFMLAERRTSLTRSELVSRLPTGETTTQNSLFRLLVNEDIIIEETRGQFDIQVNFVYEAFMEYVLSRTIRRIDARADFAEAGIDWYRRHREFPNCAGALGFYIAHLFEPDRQAFRQILSMLDGQSQQLTAVAIAIENIEARSIGVEDVTALMRLTTLDGSPTAELQLFLRAALSAISRVEPALLPDMINTLIPYLTHISKFPIEVAVMLDSISAVHPVWRLAAINHRLGLKDLSVELADATALDLLSWSSSIIGRDMPDHLTPLLGSIALRWQRRRGEWHSKVALGSERRPWAFPHAVDLLVKNVDYQPQHTTLDLSKALPLAARLSRQPWLG
jgi:hypothetical protein